MKIALGQMRVIPGDPEANFAALAAQVQEARAAGCQFVAFPELCIGGYLLADRWTDEVWCDWLLSFNERVRALSSDIAIIYGNVYLDKSAKNKDGRVRKYNAAYAWYQGQPVEHGADHLPAGVTAKCLFPNYRIFDDERYFFSLPELALDLQRPLPQLLQPFRLRLGGQEYSIGVEICEDLWFNDYSYAQRPLNVSRYLIENGADLIINLSSSPWTQGKNRARDRRIMESRNDSGRFVPFAYVNCVGSQNNGKNIVVFDGDSSFYNAQAQEIYTAARPFEAQLLIIDTTVNAPPLLKNEPSPIAAKYQAILEGIRGLDQIMGNSTFPYVIGVSGGIDSAVVACLLEQAVGKERIIAVNLPTRYNSETTKTIAGNLAHALGIRYHVIPMESLVETNLALLAEFQPTDFNAENIQAKLRGTAILSNIAGIKNGVMVNNGNKVEVALGYATLYGDVNGAIAPIADLLKTEVFELALYLNAVVYQREMVPLALIPNERFEFAMPPSAELKHAQVDPMKWGYHDALVRDLTEYRKTNPQSFVEWYAAGELCQRLEISPQLFAHYGLEEPAVFIADLEWVIKNVQKAVFKRIQAPPIIIVSKGAFGYDLRESQLPFNFSERYQELKTQVLGRGRIVQKGSAK